MIEYIRGSRRILPGAAALGFVLAASACENPVQNHHEEHGEPASVSIRLEGDEIAGAGEAGTGIASGALTVTAGKDSDPFAVVFLAEDGDAIEPDDDVYLEAEVEDDAVAGFEPLGPGAFEGSLRGLEPGQTRIRFMLMHGAPGSGHADWTSEWIDATVNGGPVE